MARRVVRKNVNPFALRERAQLALVGRRFVPMADGLVRRCELAFLLATQSRLYTRSATALPEGGRKNRRPRTFKTDRTLQTLVADLVAARTAAGMTQEQVAVRMWTTKSVVSRLESGAGTRPTLTTIEKYAVAVGAIVEIRVRTRR